MNILAFDTCLDKMYVALDSEKGVVSKVIETTKEHYHSAFLISTITSLLHENDITPKNIDIIATNIGPGSFTGIRACTTVARVMAQGGLNVKTIGVSSLEILSRLNTSQNSFKKTQGTLLPCAGEGGWKPDEGAKITIARAKNLRKDSTTPEQILWYYLRDRRFENFKFRRQVPIENYIADFVCYEKRLIIELDGSGHLQDKTIAYDKKREDFLISQNFEILRFYNNDIFDNIENVLESIYQKISNPPHHNPLPPGERKNNLTLVALDARKEMAYAAIYDNGKEIFAPQAILIEDLKQMISKENYFIVTDDSLKNEIGGISYQQEECDLGEVLITIAKEKLNEKCETNWRKLLPLYIQPPALNIKKTV